MNKADKKTVKGALEVRAKVDTNMGMSDYVIPKGTLGYILTARGRKCLVYWTNLKSRYKGDHRTGSHSLDDLEPTGNRG
jgi:hypothetical protein